jgi:hypothetical protein
MQINWQRVEERFNEIDHATYGLAEFVVIGGGFSILALGLYCVLAAVTYGYIQLFTLISGSI